MSESSQGLQSQNEIVETSDTLALRQGLRESGASVKRVERMNIEVLRQISAGNDLSTWTVQLRRRLGWMLAPMVLGGVLTGIGLQFITSPERYAGNLDYSTTRPLNIHALSQRSLLPLPDHFQMKKHFFPQPSSRNGIGGAGSLRLSPEPSRKDVK